MINDLLDSMFSTLTPRQMGRTISLADPLIPDYLQVGRAWRPHSVTAPAAVCCCLTTCFSQGIATSPIHALHAITAVACCCRCSAA